MDKTIKIKKYSKHPEIEGDKLEVTIMNNEKRKPIVKKPITPDKPKQPRMTIALLAGVVNKLAITVSQQGEKIDQLATIVAEGFAAVNHRMDVEFAVVNQKIDKEVGEIKETLKRHEEILKRHDLIFERNNLK
jgi:hypothetical protein